MKKILLIAWLCGTSAGMLAAGQEKNTESQPDQQDQRKVSVDTSSHGAGQLAMYSPTDIKVVGTLNSGQTSKPVEYSATPQYRAFVFEAGGNDQVQVKVTGVSPSAYVALADSSLKPIASGVGEVTATLPYAGPDIDAYYILFKDSRNQPTQLTVHLKRIPASAVIPAADATH